MSLNTFARPANLAALLFTLTLLTILALSNAAAQETPEDASPSPGAGETPTTPGPGATPSGETVVNLEIVTSEEEPIPQDTEFQVRVSVENVEHLGGFALSLVYDPDRVEPIEGTVDEGTAESTDAAATETPEDSAPEQDGQIPAKVTEMGQIFESSERGEALFCLPFARDNQVSLVCASTIRPVCLGGPPGASGSGTLGSFSFKGVGGGVATFRIGQSDLNLDDFELPCDPAEGTSPPIPHTVGAPVSIEIESGGGGISGVLIGVIIAVVAVVVVGGAGGYLWYRRRGASA